MIPEVNKVRDAIFLKLQVRQLQHLPLQAEQFLIYRLRTPSILNILILKGPMQH